MRSDQENRFSILESCHRLFDACDAPHRIEGAAAIQEELRKYLALHGVTEEQFGEYLQSHREAPGSSVYVPVNGDPLLSPSTWEHGSRYPRLLTYGADVSLLDTVKAELRDSSTRAAWIASAFCTGGMLNLLNVPLSEFARKRPLRLLTSVMDDFNDPEILRRLPELIPGLEARVYFPLSDGRRFRNAPPPFHLKCFLFEKRNGAHAMVVGSSNLTAGGLLRNHEWNYFTNSEGNLRFARGLSAFDQGLRELERYWNEDAVDVTNPDFLEAYRARFRRRRELRREFALRLREEETATVPQPRPAQSEALKNLASRRERGISRSAVIAATGMGKTYLAAFDYRQSGYRRVLFLVHRENVLRDARKIFRRVLDRPDFGAVLSGREKPDDLRTVDGLFATFQTMSNPRMLSRFPSDSFEYIVVDEFHHAESESWRRVIGHFKPRFLLGLTATPERMDGRDVLELCDYDVAHETRLFDAIDRGWLTPFQYYAIHDETDYSKLAWRNGRYRDEDLDDILREDTRAELIVNNLRRYLPSVGKVKALAFCATTNHARYMTARFNALGFPAACVTGDSTPPAERERIIHRLQDERDPLQVVCSVDVFGEGVDIPAVTHVLFLRPTQSFTVFLQQLGRGLRLVPEKEFLVALDFVGNFRQSYVAPLALQGYHGIDEYLARGKRFPSGERLPACCHVDADIRVRRIWDAEIGSLFGRKNREQRLIEQYWEFRSNLDHSPTLMDLFVNPAAPDPQAFILFPKFGSWLGAKSAMGDLADEEKAVIGAPGELLLRHIEKELNPNRSYKMVVLESLLEMGGTEWSVDDIARRFLDWYLANPDRIADWDDLAGTTDPRDFPVSRAAAHLMRMPLDRLADTGGEFFGLDRRGRRFFLQPRYRDFWLDSFARTLISDRVRYALARYFHRNEAETEIPFSTDRSDFADACTKIIKGNIKIIMECIETTFELGAAGGYPADVTITILRDNDRFFRGKWAGSDPTRFPVRIKAVATALLRNGCHGTYRASHKEGKVTIRRIS